MVTSNLFPSIRFSCSTQKVAYSKIPLKCCRKDGRNLISITLSLSGEDSGALSHGTQKKMKITFTTIDTLHLVVEAASQRGVNALVLRHCHDGGPRDWSLAECKAYVVDFKCADDLHWVISLMDETTPEAIIITVPPQRMTDFEMHSQEASVVQEVLWKHASRAGMIETYFPAQLH